jgi:hypothetical protein
MVKYKCNNPRCERNGIVVTQTRASRGGTGEGYICARCRRTMVRVDSGETHSVVHHDSQK